MVRIASIIAVMFMCVDCVFSIDIKDLFLENIEPIPVEKHVLKTNKHEISFFLPQGFKEVKCKLIFSKNFACDRYCFSDYVLEQKSGQEAYFSIEEQNIGHMDTDSLMDVHLGTIMPLYGDDYQTYWYNCGFINGNPFVMKSDIALLTRPWFKRTEIEDQIKASFTFDIYLKTGFCISFRYDSIRSCFNFQYEKVMDIFRSIEIREIGEQKEK